MKGYFYLKLNRLVSNVRLKNLGIFLLHLTGKRYFGLFVDPVLACNLRCRMCHFSDAEKRKTMKGAFQENDLNRLSEAFFHRALKLQIGCAAEPTIFRHNQALIALGKAKGIPYISMTTNANLLSEQDWWELAASGLNEVTISVHGVKRETYEYFMAGASFDKFLSALETLTQVKKSFPTFNVRLNYTVNKDNLAELQDFFAVLGSYRFDILQIRPIQSLGETDYHDFSWDTLTDLYDKILEPLKEACRQRNVHYIMPDKSNLAANDDNSGNNTIFASTYFYVSPNFWWKSDFDIAADTYESYSKRTHWGKYLWKNIFSTNKTAILQGKKHLNYEVS